MTLSPKVIYLVGLNFLDNADQVCSVGQIPVMKQEIRIINVGILV